MKHKTLFETIILLIEIILLFSFGIITYAKFGYSFDYYLVSFFVALITFWRLVEYGSKKST